MDFPRAQELASRTEPQQLRVDPKAAEALTLSETADALRKAIAERDAAAANRLVGGALPDELEALVGGQATSSDRLTNAQPGAPAGPLDEKQRQALLQLVDEPARSSVQSSIDKQPWLFRDSDMTVVQREAVRALVHLGLGITGGAVGVAGGLAVSAWVPGQQPMAVENVQAGRVVGHVAGEYAAQLVVDKQVNLFLMGLAGVGSAAFGSEKVAEAVHAGGKLAPLVQVALPPLMNAMTHHIFRTAVGPDKVDFAESRMLGNAPESEPASAPDAAVPQ